MCDLTPLPPCFCSPTLDLAFDSYHTPAVRTAANPVLVTITVFLHTPRLFTVASTQISSRRRRIPHHVRFKRLRVALDQRLLHFLAFFQMFLCVRTSLRAYGIIFTIETGTAIAEHVGRETLAVQLQTPRFPAVTSMFLSLKTEKQGNRMRRIGRRGIRAGARRIGRGISLRRFIYVTSLFDAYRASQSSTHCALLPPKNVSTARSTAKSTGKSIETPIANSCCRWSSIQRGQCDLRDLLGSPRPFEAAIASTWCVAVLQMAASESAARHHFRSLGTTRRLPCWRPKRRVDALRPALG